MMGWLNPFLYENQGSFARDVSFGINNCTAVYGRIKNRNTYRCCREGFHSTSGWDPVTGLGSLDFVNFLEAAGIDTSTMEKRKLSSGSTSDTSTSTTKVTILGGVPGVVGLSVGAVIVLTFLSVFFYFCLSRCCHSEKQTAKVMAIVP